MRHFYRIALLHCFVRVLRELVVSYQGLGSFYDPRHICPRPWSELRGLMTRGMADRDKTIRILNNQ